MIFDFNLLAILGKRKTWKQKFLGFMISRVAGVITLSKGAVSIFQKNFPELADRVKFIPLGTDGEYFKPRFELEQEGVILSVGRDPGRDFSTLFSTVSSLDARVFVTAKPRALEKHRPLPDNVEVKDFSPNELRDAYAEASLVVLPLGIKEDNYYDAMGCSTLVEAMAMGKAVVATRSATTESYITSGVNGLLVPAGDPIAMREAIVYLFSNHEERKRLGTAARRFVEQNCTAEIYAKNLADYFNNILEL